MKSILLILTIFLSSQLFTQIEINTDSFNKLSIEDKRSFVIEELIKDTIRYAKEDIYHAAIGTQNKKSYSELYVINGKQYFKFDIVGGVCVEEFIEKYLNKSKFKSVTKLTNNQSTALYGTNGKNGVTIITVKRLKKINTENCGFIESENNKGSNLDQWKKGELRIRD